MTLALLRLAEIISQDTLLICWALVALSTAAVIVFWLAMWWGRGP